LSAYSPPPPQATFRYSEIGVPAVAGMFCEHRAVTVMSAAFSIASAMSAPIAHMDHGLT
jgi:hypothetical protein